MMKNHLYAKEMWITWVTEVCLRIQAGQKVHFTKHFMKSIRDRGISVGRVYSIFKNNTAEIIQAHERGTYAMPDGKLNKDTVLVIMGWNTPISPIHVVVALEGTENKHYRFITAYIPNLIYFDETFKQLRPEYQNTNIYTRIN